MTEEEKRTHRCCFTGHRPEKLPLTESEVTLRLEGAIQQAVTDGFAVFISGMARGVDIWAAEIVLRLRSEGYPIKLICAIPYDGFELRWSREWQSRYERVLVDADLVRFICPGYKEDCYQRRNEWMVDHSAKVIAVWNGRPSGTGNTVRYAVRCGIAVQNLL